MVLLLTYRLSSLLKIYHPLHLLPPRRHPKSSLDIDFDEKSKTFRLIFLIFVPPKYSSLVAEWGMNDLV